MYSVFRGVLALLAVFFLFCLWVAVHRLIPCGKYGALAGFIGSLLLACPSLRQVHALFPYAGMERWPKLLGSNPKILANIKRAKEDRDSASAKFSMWDPFLYLVGAALLCASFLLDAYLPPPATC